MSPCSKHVPHLWCCFSKVSCSVCTMPDKVPHPHLYPESCMKNYQFDDPNKYVCVGWMMCVQKGLAYICMCMCVCVCVDDLGEITSKRGC